MEKTTVALLFGGVSSEHEISCLSAASIWENIDPEAYTVLPVGITKAGGWYLYDGPAEALRDASWASRAEALTPAFLTPDRTIHGLLLRDGAGFSPRRVDVAFPALHGKNGEDGTVQGLLELAGIPYVGCGVLASADCMDKDVCHTRLRAAGVPQVEWRTFFAGCDLERAAEQIREELGLPVFVKPANAGSSVGITKVKLASELPAALELAFSHDEKVVVEAAVPDPIEVECAVLGNREPLVAGPGEIVPADEFYTYDAKYHNDESKLYIPARLSPETAREIRELAAAAYRALGCRGLSRIDFLVERGSGRVVLNEPNTLPGFTSISMYPKLFLAEGLSYPELIGRLLRLALED